MIITAKGVLNILTATMLAGVILHSCAGGGMQCDKCNTFIDDPEATRCPHCNSRLD